jgi:tetratricopeptide (TPR) repeat protein
LEEAESIGKDLMRFVDEYGYEYYREQAYLLLGATMMAQRRLTYGLQMMDKALPLRKAHKRNGFLPTIEYITGNVYAQIALAAGPKDISFLMRNIGAIIKYIPKAGQRAEDHYRKAIRTASQIGNESLIASAYFDLGMLFRAKGKLDQAGEAFSKSIEYLEKLGDEAKVKGIRGLLASILDYLWINPRRRQSRPRASCLAARALSPGCNPREPHRHVAPIGQVINAESLHQARLFEELEVNRVHDHNQGKPDQDRHGTAQGRFAEKHDGDAADHRIAGVGVGTFNHEPPGRVPGG